MWHERRIYGFGGNLRERDHLEDLDVDGIRWICKKEEGASNGLLRHRDKWRALMNAVMNRRTP